MSALLDWLRDTFDRFDPVSVIDIALIALIIFWLFLLVRNTTAMSLVRGLLFLFGAALLLSTALDLTVLNWALRNSFPEMLIIVPVIFQPEIRRAFERLGRAGSRGWSGRRDNKGVADVLGDAAVELSRQRHGALVVIERDTGLEDYIDTGVRLDAELSEQLLEGIFYRNSPLHDNAAIVREGRLIAANCLLPLSERPVRGHPGTRHRAALGITERTDAVAIVVSEENGDISLAAGGRMISRLDRARLYSLLSTMFNSSKAPRLVLDSDGAGP
ncbi:MAG: TIGR00159 family protein [Dehalococcoidia bacterium]|nr:TIGR00159 family protein [Dehalococcoidia bacterium]